MSVITHRLTQFYYITNDLNSLIVYTENKITYIKYGDKQ